MADRWAALLRAVNLGSYNRVPMPELRRLLTDAGYADVATYIASGNVVLTADGVRRDALARGLEELLGDAFSVQTAVILRSAEELAAVVASHPFGEDTSRTHVAFLTERPSAAAVNAVAALELGDEDVAVAGADVYLRYPNGVGRAQLSGAKLEQHLGVPGTVRNWRTVVKLAELASG